MITSKPAKGRAGTGGHLHRSFLLLQGLGSDLGAPATGAALEDVPVVEEAVEHGSDSGGVAEHLAPVLYGSIRGEERAGALVSAHDQFEEVLGGGGRQLAHAEVVDDQQRHAGQFGDGVFAGAVE